MMNEYQKRASALSNEIQTLKGDVLDLFDRVQKVQDQKANIRSELMVLAAEAPAYFQEGLSDASDLIEQTNALMDEMLDAMRRFLSGQPKEPWRG